MKIIQIGNMRKGTPKFSNPQTGRVYSIDGIAPTINTCQGGGLEPKVVITNMKIVCERRMDEGLRTFKDGVAGAIRTIDAGGDKRVIEWEESKEDGIVYVDKKYVEKEILSDKNKDSEQEIVSDSGYRIRKLTPLESWRLMGFTDEDFLAAKVGDRKIAKELIDKYEPTEHLKMMQEADKISKVSNTQLYKQAGNSIVVDVLYYIFKELYTAMPCLFDDLKVSSYFSGIGAFESALDRLYVDINFGSIATPPYMSSESAGGGGRT